jgi:hypothetical protein
MNDEISGATGGINPKTILVVVMVPAVACGEAVVSLHSASTTAQIDI